MGRRKGKRLEKHDAVKEELICAGRNICRLCRQERNEEVFGKFFVDLETGFSVHQYCMFFSSGLAQHGEDDEGFDGFLIKDIKREISRAKRLRCYFCGKRGATIGCCERRCPKAFHYYCGRRSGALFQFFDSFNSFCIYHRPTQRIKLVHSNGQNCRICLSEIEWNPNSHTTLSEVPLVTPCCKAWFHNKCLQKHAHSSGLYYFRCPLCNNKEEFQEEMKRMGVFIPDQDASWEKDNAFADLLFRYNRCDARKCICPHGTEHKATSGKWRIRLCDLCGQFGTHLKCQRWKSPPDEWYCDVCGNTLNYSSTRKRPVVGDRSMDPFFNDTGGSSSDEDSCVNVCGVSDDDLPLAAILKKRKGTMKPNSSTEEHPFLGEPVPMRERHIETLQQKTATEDHKRDTSSPKKGQGEALSHSESEEEDSGPPMRKRRRLSGTPGEGRTGPLKQKQTTCSDSENTSCSLNGLVMESSGMTPSLLFAISKSVTEGLLSDDDATAEEKTSSMAVTPKVEDVEDSATARVNPIDEVILIKDTDSESVSDQSEGLLELDADVFQGKQMKKDSSNSKQSVEDVISRSPFKRRRYRRVRRLKRVTAARVEADSSTSVASVKVERESTSEQGWLNLKTEQVDNETDDDSCLITKVVKPPCPHGNDKFFGKCILRCCNPTLFGGPDVMTTTNSIQTNHKCEDLQITTVTCRSSVRHNHIHSCKVHDQGRTETAETKEFCSTGINTLPFKLFPRKDSPSEESTITDTQCPAENGPVSTCSQTKLPKLCKRKKGSYLERSLKHFFALHDNHDPVSHKCMR